MVSQSLGKSENTALPIVQLLLGGCQQGIEIFRKGIRSSQRLAVLNLTLAASRKSIPIKVLGPCIVFVHLCDQLCLCGLRLGEDTHLVNA